MCIQGQKDGFKGELNCKGIQWENKCPTGDVPKLTGQNLNFLNIYFRIEPGLNLGGRYDYNAIQIVFDNYQIPPSVRPVYFDKVLVVIQAIREIKANLKANDGS